jgi:phthiodiolone/phenolphthiodiolone dimycocerosates ketoreductase
MDISDIKIGIENTYTFPFTNGIRNTKIYEKHGFDSLWYTDHIMSWFPDAIWTPDLVNISTFLRKPHDFYNVFPTMAVAANNTKKPFLGTIVTETFRHHPALLAHMIITIDHISRGRVILGIGAGEGENIIPYGIKWEKPVSRLEEAIKIIKLLWRRDKKVHFDGNFWKLEDAVLSLKPFKGTRPPPIWIGAFGPKMLELTGKLGDGWLPYAMPLKEYNECLGKVQLAAKKEGRKPNDITPAIALCLLTDEKQEVCNEMLEAPLVKNQLLTSPDRYFRDYGISHPLGNDFYGALEYIPTRYNKETLLEAYKKIPVDMCKDFFVYGTPENIIEKIEEYIKVGAKHIIIVNYTTLCDINKANSSYICIKKVLDYFKEEQSKLVEPFPS